MLPGAVETTFRANSSQIRAVTIGNVGLFLDMYPAKVDNARRVDNASLVLTLDDRPALTLEIGQTSSSLKKSGGVCSFPDFTAQLDDLTQNADLRRAIGRALDDVFTIAILKITDVADDAHDSH